MRQPVVFFAALGIALGVTAANAADKPVVGLITKTNTNPFFVKMKAGAEEAATANGIELRSFAGKVDGDNDGQVAAVENLIASGAKGILITPNDSRAIVPAIEKARAAGILVIALDTPLDPPTAADATFATDNFLAGELIGQWAVKTLGPKAPSAKIALLDLNVNQISVDVARPGIPERLRHRSRQSGKDRRREGCPHRRTRRHPRQRGRRPQGDGKPVAEGSGDFRGLYHQRTGGCGRL